MLIFILPLRQGYSKNGNIKPEGEINRFIYSIYDLKEKEIGIVKNFPATPFDRLRVRERQRIIDSILRISLTWAEW